MEMNHMLKSTKGFTLIELLVALALLGVIITLMVNSKIGQQDQNITQQQAVEMQQNVRASIFLMSREIRSAGYNPEYRTYDVGITNAGANTLTFNRVASDDGDDNDNDGIVDEDGELEIITYTFQDSDGDGDNDITVAYNAGGANSIAENIQNLMFAYFDENGAVTADTSAIRSIQITVTATTNISELARSPLNNTRSLSTLIYLRNLGF
jgi:prepilin-type N-terminal cleavage/methylation domain-containing protein